MSRGQLERTELIDALTREIRQLIAETVLFFEGIAERLGMNSTDVQCMNILTNMGPITAGQLAKQTGLTTGAITGVIDRLEKVGYVRRERDPHDRRRVVIQVLPKSELEMAPLFASRQQAWTELCSHYSDEELAVVLDFIKRTHPMNQEEIAKLRAETASARKPKQVEAAGD